MIHFVRLDRQTVWPIQGSLCRRFILLPWHTIPARHLSVPQSSTNSLALFRSGGQKKAKSNEEVEQAMEGAIGDGQAPAKFESREYLALITVVMTDASS
jgi:hypothetical protein